MFKLKAKQFEDLNQQRETATFGMWLFIATEMLFFGGLFFAYSIYRFTYAQDFAAAGARLNIMIGTINTAVLLLSSYFMARSVKEIEKNRTGKAALFLATTWCLGFIFLLLKANEYYDDIRQHLLPSQVQQPAQKMFYYIYYATTGLHAFHLIIGLIIVAIIFVKTLRHRYSKEYHDPVEVTGLYWHFIDVIWIFLYPLLYLMGRHL
jgi:cytochrome c oxidase subunit 3